MAKAQAMQPRNAEQQIGLPSGKIYQRLARTIGRTAAQFERMDANIILERLIMGERAKVHKSMILHTAGKFLILSSATKCEHRFHSSPAKSSLSVILASLMHKVVGSLSETKSNTT